MAYKDYEALPEGSRPVELFRVRTQYESILLSNLDVDIFYEGETHEKSQIRRGNLTDSYDLEDGKLSVWTSADSKLGAMFKTELPAAMPTIEVIRGHLVGDSLELLLENSELLFKGNISSPTFSGSEVRLDCISLALSLTSVGLRRKFAGNCPYFLYKGSCGVQQVAYTDFVTVTGVVGEVVSTDMEVKPDGYYRGGLLKIRNSHMMIANYTGNQNITLLAPVAGLKVGDVVEISAGCDKSKTTCQNRFNNYHRFGGWTTIPTVNYFESGIG